MRPAKFVWITLNLAGAVLVPHWYAAAVAALFICAALVA